jgi:hypothetical protein
MTLVWGHSVAFGWGIMLQAGRARVLLPMRSLDFSIDLSLPAALWPLGSTERLTEMSTRNLHRGKCAADMQGWQPYRHLWTDCLEMWKPRRLTTLWASTACYRSIFTFFTTLVLETIALHAWVFNAAWNTREQQCVHLFLIYFSQQWVWEAVLAQSVFWLCTGWTNDVRVPSRTRIFPLSSASRPTAVGTIQPHIQWVSG